MSYVALSVARPRSGVALITLSRPGAANALNKHISEELTHAFVALGDDVRAVVLTGEGEKAFCAGADLKERMGMTPEAWENQHVALRSARDAVLNCTRPVIAAVNGVAMGGGLELALSCDFIYAAKHAKFALPEVKLGIIPGLGGTQLLQRSIPERRARELILTGQHFTAQEAMEWGMLNRVFTAAELLPETLKVAESLAEGAPIAVQSIKDAMRRGCGKPLVEALLVERDLYTKNVATHDRIEGISAFNEKRKPNFTGS